MQMLLIAIDDHVGSLHHQHAVIIRCVVDRKRASDPALFGEKRLSSKCIRDVLVGDQQLILMIEHYKVGEREPPIFIGVRFLRREFLTSLPDSKCHNGSGNRRVACRGAENPPFNHATLLCPPNSRKQKAGEQSNSDHSGESRH